MATKFQATRVGLLALSVFSAIGFQFLVVAPAKADCEYAGRTYQTGQEDGSLICMPDGTMQPK